jgi:hypothetical protein
MPFVSAAHLMKSVKQLEQKEGNPELLRRDSRTVNSQKEQGCPFSRVSNNLRNSAGGY